MIFLLPDPVWVSGGVERDPASPSFVVGLLVNLDCCEVGSTSPLFVFRTDCGGAKSRNAAPPFSGRGVEPISCRLLLPIAPSCRHRALRRALEEPALGRWCFPLHGWRAGASQRARLRGQIACVRSGDGCSIGHWIAARHERRGGDRVSPGRRHGSDGQPPECMCGGAAAADQTQQKRVTRLGSGNMCFLKLSKITHI